MPSERTASRRSSTRSTAVLAEYSPLVELVAKRMPDDPDPMQRRCAHQVARGRCFLSIAPSRCWSSLRVE